MIDNVFDLIAAEEGFREAPYHCTEGYPTIGIGFRIGPKGAPLDQYQFKVTHTVARELTSDHILKIKSSLNLDRMNISEPRQAVIISLAYQTGVAGSRKFIKMWAAISCNDWETAADEYLDSLAARKTPERFERGAKVLRKGVFSAKAS